MEKPRLWRCGMGMAILILGVALVAFAPGVLAQDQGASESSLGASISGFMQSTAADAGESVESGMWEQQFETDADPNRSVDRRAEALRSRLSALSEQSDALEAARRDGTVSGVEYTARASAIHAQLAGVRAAIDRTADRAQRRGVDASTLDDLRETARTSEGPGVSSVARDIATAGRDTGQATPGPPTDSGPPGDGGPPDGAGNGDGGPPDGAGNGEGGPPDDAGNSDQGGDGAPDDAGTSDRGNGNGGPPDEAGNGDQGSDNDGQSDNAGNGDQGSDNGGQSDNAGNSDQGSDNSGQSDNAGNSDQGSDNGGQSDNAGNSDQGSDNGGQSEDAGTSDESPGNSGDGSGDNAGNGGGPDDNTEGGTGSSNAR